MDKLEMLLPCGGEIWLNFVEFPSAVKTGHVDVRVFPHVKCPGTYANGKGCPWLDRLRKCYTIARGLEERVVDGEVGAVKEEADVQYRNRVVRQVRDDYGRGIAFVAATVLYDRELRPKHFEEPKDVFDECQDVYIGHGKRIIAFLKRCFGKAQ